MCRLFGFRSIFSSKVHSSLVSADNALINQSDRHPDGWGVAYYQEGAPHIIKTTQSAMTSQLFLKVSGVVHSETVLGHLRKATIGDLSVVNAHPFQYGPWVFAHNGNLKDFSKHKGELRKYVDESISHYILGDTDSEIIFFMLLSEIKKTHALSATNIDSLTLRNAVKKVVETIEDTVGPILFDDEGHPSDTFITFIMTNGTTMLAHQGGKSLHYSTYKKRCPERDTCGFFGDACETEATDKVNHAIFSSEPLQGENVWIDMKNGEIVCIDESLGFSLGSSR